MALRSKAFPNGVPCGVSRVQAPSSSRCGVDGQVESGLTGDLGLHLTHGPLHSDVVTGSPFQTH